MKFLKAFVYISMAAIFVVTTANAVEKVTFATFPIPLMVVDENTGVFIELVKTISSRAGFEISIQITPPVRTVSNFANNKAEVLFPAIDVFFPPDQKYLKSSEIIYVKTDFIFTRKGDPLFKTINDIEGKKVGITRGYPYAKALMENKSIIFDIANGDEINVRKLMAKRIDVFVVEEKSGLKAFEDEGQLDQMHYDATSPVSKQDVFFAFQADARGKQLEQLISKALLELKKDGTFGKIMAKAQ
ncbi:transporter substrate-binding domain-containing protein [bacterium]|nr:transporter substrate-binding domain-containing protein [bacterium]